MKDTNLSITHEESLWQEEKSLIERKLKLRNEKKELYSKYKRKFNTTKLIVFFIFINLTAIEIFSMYMTYKSMDLSALVALIGAIIGESITFIAYVYKSTKENTSGGIIYDMALNNQCDNSSNIDDNGGNG